MVEKLIPRAAAHNVQLVVLLSSVSFQLCKGFRIALCKAAVGTAEIVADAENPPVAASKVVFMLLGARNSGALAM